MKPLFINYYFLYVQTVLPGWGRKKKIKRVRWTEDQKRVMTMFFKDHVKTKTPPKKHEVEVLIGQHKKLFKGKNWVIIKAFVYNCYRKR